MKESVLRSLKPSTSNRLGKVENRRQLTYLAWLNNLYCSWFTDKGYSHGRRYVIRHNEVGAVIETNYRSPSKYDTEVKSMSLPKERGYG